MSKDWYAKKLADIAIGWSVSSRLKKKPGEAILRQPKHIRDKLKEMKSDDIKDVRLEEWMCFEEESTEDWIKRHVR